MGVTVERTQNRLRKEQTRFIIFTGPRDRRHGVPHRATWKRHQGGQEAEDRKGKV